MMHSVKDAWAIDSTALFVEFDDGRRGTHEMTPLIGQGVFAKLADPTAFRSARTDGFTVVWPCGLAIALEELYENCVPI